VTVHSTKTIAADLDLFSDEVLADPHPYYAALREQAAVVHLPQTGHGGVWAVTRYEAVRRALADTKVFSSKAVAFNDQLNAGLANTVFGSDPPDHRRLRAATMEHLTPRALRGLAGQIDKKADAMVAALVERGQFDAITDLAQPLPVAVVMDFIGVQGEVREKMLRWGSAAFNVMGPMNRRTIENLPIAGELGGWLSQLKARELAEGSIGRAILDAGDRGVIPPETGLVIIQQYVAAGLDSTVAAIGNVIALLSANQDQFALVRSSPDLIPSAFSESLRYEAPAPITGRLVTEDIEIEGTVMPAGSQAAILLGAANRDPRHYQDPERFDVTRKPQDQLSFGYGIHSCAGQGLAKLEAHAVIGALARRVRRYTVGEGTRRISNSIRGLAALPVISLEAA
jgi:cytochrome P450